MYLYKMPKPPTPDTRTAWLPSAGYDLMRATPHRFLEARETSVQESEGVWEDVWEFIWVCELTGAERRWGYQSRNLAPAVPIA